MAFEWTGEVIAEAKRLAAMDLTAAEIAAGLGPHVTRNMVIGKFRREGIPLGSQKPYAKMARMRSAGYAVHWSTAADSTLKRMFQLGTRLKDMARHFGCGEDTVRVRLSKFNLSIRDREDERRRKAISPLPVTFVDPNPRQSLAKPRSSRMPALLRQATETPPEGSRPISLLDAGPFDCRWISGDPRQGALCCGAPIATGLSSEKRSYCTEHMLRAYAKHEPAAEAEERERRRNQARQISVGEARVFA